MLSSWFSVTKKRNVLQRRGFHEQRERKENLLRHTALQLTAKRRATLNPTDVSTAKKWVLVPKKPSREALQRRSDGAHSPWAWNAQTGWSLAWWHPGDTALSPGSPPSSPRSLPHPHPHRRGYPPAHAPFLAAHTAGGAAPPLLASSPPNSRLSKFHSSCFA